MSPQCITNVGVEVHEEPLLFVLGLCFSRKTNKPRKPAFQTDAAKKEVEKLFSSIVILVALAGSGDSGVLLLFVLADPGKK